MFHLYRFYRADGTYGLITDGAAMPVCAVLERPWKGNERDLSCIPEGIYLVRRRTSPTRGEVWEIQGVPGRADILIHTANWVHELKGCLAPGLYHGELNGKPAVVDSGKGLDKLNAAIGDTDTWDLEITGVNMRVGVARLDWVVGEPRDSRPFPGQPEPGVTPSGEVKIAGRIPWYKRVWMFLDGKKTLIGLLLARIGEAMNNETGEILRVIGDLLAFGGIAHKAEKSTRGLVKKKR